MIGVFWDIFNQPQVTIIIGKYLKMIRDTYRPTLEKTPKNDRPPMISDM